MEGPVDCRLAATRRSKADAPGSAGQDVAVDPTHTWMSRSGVAARSACGAAAPAVTEASPREMPARRTGVEAPAPGPATAVAGADSSEPDKHACGAGCRAKQQGQCVKVGDSMLASVP